MRKFPNPLLTAINIEVQRFNSRMILERQPPRIDLIETSFIKCKAEVAKKRVEAAKKIRLNSKIVIKQNQNISCNGMSNSSKQEQLSSDCGFPTEPHDDKWPPDPPKTINSSHKVPYDNISAREHPLAKQNVFNSQPMSAQSSPTSSVLNQRKKTTFTQAPKRWLRGKDIKDADAVQWEPPKLDEDVNLGKKIKLDEDVNLGKIISHGEGSINPVCSE